MARGPGKPQPRKAALHATPPPPESSPHSQPTRVRLGCSLPPSHHWDLGWRYFPPLFPFHQSPTSGPATGSVPSVNSHGVGLEAFLPLSLAGIGLEVLPPPSSEIVLMGVTGPQGPTSAHMLGVAAVAREAMLSVLRQHHRAIATSPTRLKLGRPTLALPPQRRWASDNLVDARTRSLLALRRPSRSSRRQRVCC